MARYQRPGFVVKSVANPVLGLLIGRLGMTPGGAHLLEVRGRLTGEPRTVPVNPLTLKGHRYLVAPRGETEWVRNLRASGEGTLRVGRTRERILARELPDADKPPVLRAYLDRWHGQVRAQFGVPKDASPEQLAEIAANHPVFVIHNREMA